MNIYILLFIFLIFLAVIYFNLSKSSFSRCSSVIRGGLDKLKDLIKSPRSKSEKFVINIIEK